MILRIISGPLEGKTFPVEENATLGRSKGNIILEDSKVSNPHAQIHKSNNQYILKNLSSKRGILYQDRTVSFIVLQPGVIFQLGSTTLQVDEAISSELFDLEGSSKEEDFSSLSEFNIPEPSEEDMKHKLLEQLESYKESLRDENKILNFLKKPIKLHFEKGVQKDTIWNIFYLPRKIGSINTDLPIIDPHAPKISFEIFLEKEHIMFFTCHKESVLLNYQYVQKKRLNHDDLIIIGASYIRISID